MGLLVAVVRNVSSRSPMVRQALEGATLVSIAVPLICWKKRPLNWKAFSSRTSLRPRMRRVLNCGSIDVSPLRALEAALSESACGMLVYINCL